MAQSIVLLPENNFLMQPRLSDTPGSINQFIQLAVYEDWKKHKRLPNSIHCSNYWHTCDFAFMAERRGVDPGWEDFNISNVLSAEAGDDSHVNFQKYLVECGLALKIPSFDPDEDRRNYERAHGILVDAIEINLWDYYKPLYQGSIEDGNNEEIYQFYYDAGFGLSLVDWGYYLQLLTEYYRFGVRLDSYIVKPGAYDRPMPCEIKSTKEKKFLEIQDWARRYLHWQRSGGRKRGIKPPKTPQKVIDYIYQTQMQMHFMPDPFTGKVPDWGCVYIVNRNDESDPIELFVKYNPQHVAYWLPVIRARKLLWDSMAEGKTNPTKENCYFCIYNKHVCEDPNRFPRFGSWKKEFGRGTDNSAWAQPEEDFGFEFLVQAS